MRSDDDVTWVVKEKDHMRDYMDLLNVARKFKSAYQNMWRYHYTEEGFRYAFDQLISIVDRFDNRATSAFTAGRTEDFQK